MGVWRHGRAFGGWEHGFTGTLKCWLTEPSPFGNKPAAKMILETNGVSLARKNTEHTYKKDFGYWAGLSSIAVFHCYKK